MKYNLDFFASSDGRISRFDFWVGNVILALLYLVFELILSLSLPKMLVSINLIVAYSFVVFSSIILYIKRLHDRGYSGRRVWLMFIPIIGIVWIFIQTGILKGDSGENKFGTDPLLDNK